MVFFENKKAQQDLSELGFLFYPCYQAIIPIPANIKSATASRVL